MKSNKKGWGLAMMIVFMSILLAFLLLTVIMVYNFYRYKDQVLENQNSENEQEPQLNNNQYIQNNIRKYRLYESRIKQDAITYVYTYYVDIDEAGTIITVEEMEDKDIMSQLIDPEDNSVCTGYAKVEVKDGKIVSTPYLKCNNYEK